MQLVRQPANLLRNGDCDAPRNEVNLFTHTHTPTSPDGGATGAAAAPPPPPSRGGCEVPRFAAAPMDARLGDIVNPETRSVAFAPCTATRMQQEMSTGQKDTS
jgi:hypothetical protein